MNVIIKVIFFAVWGFYTLALNCANSVFIVIHGTWGSESNWYMPGGDFFDALECAVSTKDSAVVPFSWSGGCGHEARIKAAHNLVKLIKTYNPTVAIYCVAHSHGGNVCTLASQFLADDVHNKHRIRALYTLGTPVMSNYLPNMNTILYLYNLFSFEDLVQPVLGISQREYPEHKRIANLRVFVEGKQPDHASLHGPIIAQWLPYIHRQFKQYLRQKNILNTIQEPSIIKFNYARPLEFAYDIERKTLADRDRQLSVLILSSLRKTVQPHALTHFQFFTMGTQPQR